MPTPKDNLRRQIEAIKKAREAALAVSEDVERRRAIDAQNRAEQEQTAG